jgi:hypothetical protein
MITRMVVPAIMASILLATPAMAAKFQPQNAYTKMTAPAGHAQLAATMTAAERCAALESQFDSVITSHESAAKASAAKTLRSEAGQLCENRSHVQGIAKLENALRDLGVTPKS